MTRGPTGPLNWITDTIKDIFHYGRSVNGVIGRLTHQLVVKRFMGDIHHQEKHLQAFDLIDSMRG